MFEQSVSHQRMRHIAAMRFSGIRPFVHRAFQPLFPVRQVMLFQCFFDVPLSPKSMANVEMHEMHALPGSDVVWVRA